MVDTYIVIELQKNGDILSGITYTYDNLKNAQFKFYTVAASAAISEVDLHSVVLLSERGLPMDRVTFEHGEEYLPVPETVPEE